MAINIAGVIGIVVFYAFILVVGIWAAHRRKKNAPDNIDRGNSSNEHDDMILAGRNISCLVGTFTMTATWVSGGYINGTAQSVYTHGLVATHAPWGYALSLIIGGAIFAKKMRDAGYVTMLDPLQEKYGKVMGVILFVPALLGELFWSAAIFASLGATLSVVLEIDMDYGVIVSACVAVIYTFVGGLYVVAMTDVVQLLCVIAGLSCTIPFAILNDNVKRITDTRHDWIGVFDMATFGEWMDYALLLCLGGIPWQAYFQRVLSAKSARCARMLSFSAGAGCIVMAIPAILIGAIARSTDWVAVLNNTDTSYLKSTGEIVDKRLVLPLVIQYLTPTWVSFVGLGAISAAVMSSVDSSILAASSMLSYNIYKMAIRKKASTKELLWIIRICILVFGGAATVMGLKIKTIYNLWVLSSDLVFVVLFPQLLCAVYMKSVNVYGSILAFVVGIVLRVCGGEKMLSVPSLIRYPFYNELLDKQYFPYRTFAMTSSLVTLITGSFLANYCTRKFKSGKRTQQEIDILKISYKEPERSTVTSFSKISRWSGSYNNITASALELRNRSEDRSLLKTTLNRNTSSASQRPDPEVYDERLEI